MLQVMKLTTNIISIGPPRNHSTEDKIDEIYLSASSNKGSSSICPVKCSKTEYITSFRG